MTTGSGNYAARANALRDTAKWIAAIFAGAGAVLFSGLSFTNLEKVTGSDAWILPVVLAALPVVAAAAVVGGAARIISKPSPSVASLVSGQVQQNLDQRSKKLRDEVEKLVPVTVATFGGIAEFEQRLVDVRERIAAAEASYADQRTTDNRKAVEAEYEKLAGMQDGVNDLLLCAEFVQVEKLYRHTRWLMLAAALLGVAGAAASGVVAGHSSRGAGEQVRAANINGPLEVHIYLTAGDPHAPCPIQNGQAATAIGGTLIRPLLVLPATSRLQGAVGTCGSPWMWTTPETGVVVVPAIGGGNP